MAKTALITGITGQDGSYQPSFYRLKARRSTDSSAGRARSTPTGSTLFLRILMTPMPGYFSTMGMSLTGSNFRT